MKIINTFDEDIPQEIPSLDRYKNDRLNFSVEVASDDAATNIRNKSSFQLKDSPRNRYMIHWHGASEKKPKNKKHCGEKIINIPVHCLFSWKLPSNFVQSILTGDTVNIPSNTVIDMSMGILMQLNSHSIENDHLSASIVKSQMQTIIEMASQLGGNTGTTQDDKDYSPQVKKCIKYLVTNMKEEVTIERVAKDLQLDSTYISRLFRKECGKSIVQFLTEYRLLVASYILGYTDQPILDVVFDCGFGSVSQFYKVFKKQYGLSPKEYRSNFNS